MKINNVDSYMKVQTSEHSLLYAVWVRNINRLEPLYLVLASFSQVAMQECIFSNEDR